MRFHASLCILSVLTSFVALGHNDVSDGRKYLDNPLPGHWDVSESMSDSALPDNWWNTFSDPLLDSLVNIGESNNYNVGAAARRIDMARAAVRQSESGYYPQIGVSAGWTRQRQSGRIASNTGQAVTTSWYSAGATMSWEIDVFGKIRSRVKESKKSLEVTSAEFNGVMLSLQAQIVTTYFNLLVYRAQLAIAKEHSVNQKHILDITQARLKTGLVSKLDVAQAQTLYYSTIASIPLLESSIESSYNALGVLLGVGRDGLPEAIYQERDIPEHDQLAGAGAPLELLRRRPDIVAAEKNIDVAAASLGVARSEYLPSLSVSASIGTSAHSFDELFGKQSLTYSVAPTLSWTLFDGFDRRYVSAQAKANMEMMIDNYNLTVQTAVEEVRNAISDYNATLLYIGSLAEVVKCSQETVTLSLDRYTQGLSDFYNVVQAQLTYLSNQNSLVAARGRALISLTDLYKALGGGIKQ